METHCLGLLESDRLVLAGLRETPFSFKDAKAHHDDEELTHQRESSNAFKRKKLTHVLAFYPSIDRRHVSDLSHR